MPVTGLCYSVSLTLHKGLGEVKGSLFLQSLFGEVTVFWSKNLGRNGAMGTFQKAEILVQQRQNAKHFIFKFKTFTATAEYKSY